MRRTLLVGFLSAMVITVLPGFTLPYGGTFVGGTGIASADDLNGDLNSNCHTGAKGRGAGGNDKVDEGDCILDILGGF
ncbi:MAG TPA: hypothetical protein VKZ50_06900 [bacterium]|nr:hypothetical protein [bacterium]